MQRRIATVRSLIKSKQLFATISQRHFANPFGEDALVYDPIEEEKEIEFNKRVSAIKGIERQEEDELLHGDDGGMIFKYDLPVLNMPIKFNTALAVLEEEKALETSVEKLFEILDCDKDTAYESFIIKFNQEYNHEVDMYGDI
jgi:hypothetical protein